MQDPKLPSNVISKDFKVKIVNVVSTFSLDTTLDLKEVHQRFENESLFEEAKFNYKVVILKVKKRTLPLQTDSPF